LQEKKKHKATEIIHPSKWEDENMERLDDLESSKLSCWIQGRKKGRKRNIIRKKPSHHKKEVVSQHGKYWDTTLDKLECIANCRRLVKLSIREKETHTRAGHMPSTQQKKEKKYRKKKKKKLCKCEASTDTKGEARIDPKWIVETKRETKGKHSHWAKDANTRKKKSHIERSIEIRKVETGATQWNVKTHTYRKGTNRTQKIQGKIQGKIQDKRGGEKKIGVKKKCKDAKKKITQEKTNRKQEHQG
jgi:hypothetical protein